MNMTPKEEKFYRAIGLSTIIGNILAWGAILFLWTKDEEMTYIFLVIAPAVSGIIAWRVGKSWKAVFFGIVSTIIAFVVSVWLAIYTSFHSMTIL